MLRCMFCRCTNSFKYNVRTTSEIIKNQIIQNYNFSSSLNASFSNEIQDDIQKPNKIPEYQIIKDRMIDESENPDIFGTLSVQRKINLKAYEDDEGDKKEEQLSNFVPTKRLSTKQYADMIKKFIKERKIKEAIDVLEIKMIKEDRVKPNNYVYNLLIGGCGRVGYTKKAFMLFNDMKKRGFSAHPGCYTALFNACANSPWKSDGLERAHNLRQLMLEKRYEPNDSNYHAMIKAFGRCGDTQTAFTLVDEMLVRHILITNDTINFLLQACITDTEQGLRNSVLVWRKMLSKNIKPNLYSFNLLLRVVRDCDIELESVKDLIKEVLGDSVQVSLLENKTSKMLISAPEKQTNVLKNKTEISVCKENVTQNQLTNTEVSSDLILEYPMQDVPNLISKTPHLGNIVELQELNKPEHRLLLLGGCSGFLREMEIANVFPDIKTFTQLLDCVPSTIAAENYLLSKMKKYKIKPDIDFYNMLIKRRNFRGDFEKAKEVLILIEKSKLRPDIITFGVLALGCKHKDDAIILMTMMAEHNYRINCEILCAMLYHACYQRHFGYILEIMETILREDIYVTSRLLKKLEDFQKKCTKIAHGSDNEKVANSRFFKNGYEIFNKRYMKWLTEIKRDNADDCHPWEQFRKPTETETKRFKDKSVHFKARHLSKYRVKTSNKVRY